jgi:hypothetical protein
MLYFENNNKKQKEAYEATLLFPFQVLLRNGSEKHVPRQHIHTQQ